jgi:hypothetical protein
MKNEAEIMYKSNGKTPDGNPFMTVKKARGYYEYAERGGIDSIFFILYDSNIEKFALINESKPPLDERFNQEMTLTTAFGGSIDSKKSPKEICQIEVREESGYDIEIEDISYIGETMVSTQMSQIAKGYLVDVTNYDKTLEAECDSTNENIVWMTAKEVINNSDWKSIFIMCKMS